MLPFSLSSGPSALKGVNQKPQSGDPCEFCRETEKLWDVGKGGTWQGPKVALDCRRLVNKLVLSRQSKQNDRNLEAGPRLPKSSSGPPWQPKGKGSRLWFLNFFFFFFESSLHNLKLGGTQKSHLVSPCTCQLESWLRVSRDNNHTKG